MKLIEKYKSPNFNKRKNNQKPKYIILHYTAMANYFEAIEHLCMSNNKVSSHFLIDKKGNTYSLVDLKDRAWHAGNSYWKGLSDINSSSIGIEIDNSGHYKKFEKYRINQIKSLIKLIKKLKIKYNISIHNILGHSDIAPFRKNDPGEKFPWHLLKKEKLSYLPKIKKNFFTNKISTKKDFEKKLQSQSIKMLRKIGYDTRQLSVNSQKYKFLITAYQRHYRQSDITGKVDLETFLLISQHFKDLLTY